jgi:DNA-binding transcriptional MerR regulator
MLLNVVSNQSSLKNYLRIREAAGQIGVHPDTLRRWERLGKIVVFRHPINSYRLYRLEDLEALLKEVQRP